VDVEFERQVSDTDQQQRTTARFYIPPVISSAESLDLQNLTATLQNSIESFTSRGSGWNVSSIRSLSLCIGVFRPTAGFSFIPTPAEILKKKATINVRNHNSNDCFQYSILAARAATSNGINVQFLIEFILIAFIIIATIVKAWHIRNKRLRVLIDPKFLDQLQTDREYKAIQ